MASGSVFTPWSGSIEDEVFIGFWINRSVENAFSRPTLTLTQQQGALLIAFLALYVGAAVRNLWKLTRFFLHIMLSQRDGQDGVYQQRQAILRNTVLPLDAILELGTIALAWRTRAKSTLKRILPVTIFAIAISIFAVLAGIFSSRLVLNSTNRAALAVLLGSQCGELPKNPLKDVALAKSEADESIYIKRNMIDAFAYADSCYLDAGLGLPKQCDTFPVPSLPYTVDRNAPCPFGEGLCASNVGNLRIDMNDIDSISHLGLRQGPHFLMQHRQECAPLNKTGYTENADPGNATSTKVIYNYGKLANYTLDTAFKPNRAEGSYYIRQHYTADNMNSSLINDEFRSPRALTTVVFLNSEQMVYDKPTPDPWFGAGEWQNSTFTKNRTYVHHHELGVLGCKSTIRYCKPNYASPDDCYHSFTVYTPEERNTTISRLWPNPADAASIRPIIIRLASEQLGSPQRLYNFDGVPSLLARSTMVGAWQAAELPANQWQLETEYLFKTSNALRQSLMIDWARGLTAVPDVLCPEGIKCQRNCKSQLFRSARHYSFNTGWLVLTILLGALIMILALFLEDIFSWICRLKRFQHFDQLKHGRSEWEVNSTLQLQRLAHERAGAHAWANGEHAVPVTANAGNFGVVNLADKKHPGLVYLRAHTSGSDNTERIELHPKSDYGYRDVPQTPNAPKTPDQDRI